MPTDDNAKAGDTAQGKDGEPKYATLEEITDSVSEMINKAITNRNKQVETKVEKLVGELSKKFEEQLTKLTESQTPKETLLPVGESKKQSKESDAPRIEDSPVFKDFQKQIATLQKELETTQKEKRAERDRAREQVLRQKVSDELVKSGIDPARVRHAVGLLVDAEKRIRYVDDTDEIVFNLDEGDTDLRDGLKSWAKTEDAKIYMPARGTTGTATQRTNDRRGSNTTEDAAEKIGLSLFDALKGGIL